MRFPENGREHFPDTEPYPPFDAPRWAIWLASWCERHPKAVGRALTGATAGAVVAVVVLGAVRS